MRWLEGMEKRRAPFNDWIHGTLSAHMRSVSLDAQQYDLTFDMLEILIALSYAYHERRPEGWYWVPLGAYEYRRQNRTRILEGMEGSLATLQDGSPYVKSGIFGESATECLQKIDDFKRFLSSLPRY